MIVVSHNFLIVESIDINGNLAPFDSKLTIGQTIYKLAKQYDTEIIVWCHEKVKDVLNLDYINTNLSHDRLLFSYNPFENFLPSSIGYVEDSPFININKKVQYPTWQMSSYVGAIRAKTILLTDFVIWNTNSFDYCLNSIAKSYQILGLFCYSNHNLVRELVLVNLPKASTKLLFEFVNQHYKKIWVYLLLLNLFIYEKKFPVFAFLATFFISKLNVPKKELSFEDTPKQVDYSKETIDVIIPTIGRKKYLYDVLCDLRVQTHLPKNVIIVEQNPLMESTSELDYIINEKWPFNIRHIFTHQTGACQARNKALNEIKSKWCFLADDDITFSNSFLSEGLKGIKKLELKAVIFSCLLKNQINKYLITSQTGIFGSGCSIVSSENLNDIYFNEKLEFGYGEDTEFGLQLRHKGVDIIYLPSPEIIHLKAPVGGFRTKFSHPWEEEKIQPKPSPTVLYFRLKYYTKEQVKGYKIVLFLKFYKSQSIKNPFTYLHYMKARWNQSIKWANILLQEDEV